MIFSNPAAFVLLLALIYSVYLGWPRQPFRRSRDLSSLLLRSVILLLLIFSAAGAQIAQSSDRLAVVFLVDVSDSMLPDMQEQQLETLRESIRAMGADDQFGVVLFGANAVPERPVSSLRELEAIRSAPITNNTDLAAALRLGMAMFPPDSARRLVILTDGQPTTGDTDEAVRLAAATGIEISYVLYERPPLPDVRVTDFRVPNTVNEGQTFDLNITIEASDPTPAEITLFARGDIIHTEQVNLREGITNFTLPVQSVGAGFKDFQVTIDPAGGDGFYQNNQLFTFSRVVGPPRVLLVAGSEDEVRYLLPGLEESGITVDVATPSALPTGIAGLAQYESVILANVPAGSLSLQRMENLQRYVRDLGGGLVVLGGPEAYGPGGYYDTPLEQALPVEMQIKDQQRLPQLTIAYVIDRSGSMGVIGPSGVTNLDLAKEAMIRSIDFLQPTDRAAVVSFDSIGYMIAPFQPIYDRVSLQRLIATMRSGGGTDILAGMRLTAQEIVNEPSDRKHIILLTDGGAAPNHLVELSRVLYENYNTTTSVIAITDGPASFLEAMARAGGGKYHVVQTIESIPAIFAAETVLATRSYIIEGDFMPTLTANNPIMEGIRALPALKGYIAVTPKLASQVVLRGPAPHADPLLTVWQYGLGRTVAFTSDATARWGANWVQWNEFSRFWGQTVRWTMTEGASNNLESRVVMENEQARLIVDARSDSGEFLNGLNLQLSLIAPQSSASALIALQQVAPGRYEAVFDAHVEGAYFMRLTGSGIQNNLPLEVTQTTGWVRGYSAEYQAITPAAVQDAQNLMQGIAALTGGRELKDNPADAFLHNIRIQNATTPLWPWLLLAVLLLLPFDIALRRLLVTRADLRRLRVYLFGEPPPEVNTERLSSLRDARERARRRTEQPETAVSAVSSLLSTRRAERDTTTPPPVEEKPRYSPPAPPPPVPPDPDSTLAGRLLKRRKSDETEN